MEKETKVNNFLTAGASKFRLFINENSAWQRTIDEHSLELPVFKEMLTEVIPVEKSLQGGRGFAEDHFNRLLLAQQKEMQELNSAIGLQQKRLVHDCENEAECKYDIDTLCTQDILRERIRVIEKDFIELKCNFMNYLSSLL